MLIGYAIIAVPTGIFTSNMMRGSPPPPTRPINCPQCSRAGHQSDARYCRFCGSHLRTDDKPEAPPSP
jgi:voltage-gated potassium channel